MAGYIRSDFNPHGVGGSAAARPGQVSVLLAAAIVASIPISPIATIGLPAGRLSITWLMIFTAASLADALISSLMQPSTAPRDRTIWAASLAAVLLMLPSALFTSEGASGYLAYLNFVVGVCAGVRVGSVWASLRRESLNLVDYAVFSFVLATVIQLIIGFSGAQGIQSLHQNASTPWGNSNYVAGVLVVVGMLVLGRAQLLSRGRALAYLIAALGFAAAVSTLSRGGVTALAVGIAAALWMLPARKISKFFMRLLALGLPVVAWIAVDLIQNERAKVNSQVHENVDTRFGLWALAWRAIQESPVFGTGWAYFRTLSAPLEQQTFAHNMFLSYLQIGGLLFGLPLIAILLWLWVRSMSRLRQMGPALLALFAIAQTDPFTEGTVGGMTGWIAVAFALTIPLSNAPQADDIAHSDRRGRPSAVIRYP